MCVVKQDTVELTHKAIFNWLKTLGIITYIMPRAQTNVEHKQRERTISNLVYIPVSNIYLSDNLELSRHTQPSNEHCGRSFKSAEGMKLICFNVRSLFPKLEEIRLLAVDTKPHLIGLVETCLNDSIDTLINGVICDRQLITCKRYISIDFSSSKLKKEPAFLDRLGDIVGEEIALFEPRVSKYLCEPCDVKVTKCIKIKKSSW